ncbi:MAG: DNA gyrase inhibitor YacG [Acidobacteria bacterium]|nr:DNA gyrase inhibitor YacG [Acidobacteriota bacterium]
MSRCPFMKCPLCGKEVKDLKQPCRPFCSERCKLIDLGNWISGEYRVPLPETNEKDGENATEDPGEE